MQKSLLHIVVSGFIIFSFVLGLSFKISLAESTPSPAPQTQPASLSESDKSPDVDVFSMRVSKRLEFLNQIKQELQSAESTYSGVKSTLNETENRLNDIQAKATTLTSQLNNLDQQISNTTSIIEQVFVQVTENENTLKQLNEQLQLKNVELKHQKELLMDYLKFLYSKENAIKSTMMDDSSINMAKLLLSDKPAGQTLQELKYFNILEESGHEIFSKLEKSAKEQTVRQFQIENVRNKLTRLYSELEEQRKNLQVDRLAKEQLLDETKGQEKIYQQLLEESKKQHNDALFEITALRDNLIFIQEKIAQLGDKFNPDDYQGILDRETTSIYDYIKSTSGDEFLPIWPVSPGRGVSAYFHDSSYQHAFGVPHNAVDIRAPQGTPIKAVADAVVYKAVDNGYGYSYITLAHGGGFMSLYGHVSEIRVKPGEKVKQGQTIGLSGATPGTKGAGYMTTGPHLHFEVFKDSKHVDPLYYLSLSMLPLGSLPEKYQMLVTGETKVKRGVNE
jgi:murein DD-endopeptidase MepM/ murein hydrolase activator NlpD